MIYFKHQILKTIVSKVKDFSKCTKYTKNKDIEGLYMKMIIEISFFQFTSLT
ncbi:DEHA2A14630p [Debaryomyces hansenii CBS767]|uniref:DEHA2A14630p n=1 Tax=Debaryomyces hansenii (strain ATCC 36239 / CBS 767 / BCRC 21394 / JCM 1990 / NBRC 0083 / IGC 2968) TaxID=284592 RepID=B5RSN3_DEBHA|nr:DEHA2A14630p [Debaryomyces hansenii CBS767]CAR65418.1 DEHA2A14630p [Debaryomyces hansenii CBS767]|eukprot:XP_002770043.1 DEHA2A14630p [Debaryomyces hansenii CBS767]